MGYRIAKEFATLDSKEIAKGSSRRSLSMLGQELLKRKLSCDLRNDAFVDLVEPSIHFMQRMFRRAYL